MPNDDKKKRPATDRRVNLGALRAETTVYREAALWAERLINARDTLAQDARISVEIPTLPDNLDTGAVMAAFAQSDPPEDITKR